MFRKSDRNTQKPHVYSACSVGNSQKCSSCFTTLVSDYILSNTHCKISQTNFFKRTCIFSWMKCVKRGILFSSFIFLKDLRVILLAQASQRCRRRNCQLVYQRSQQRLEGNWSSGKQLFEYGFTQHLNTVMVRCEQGAADENKHAIVRLICWRVTLRS